MKTKRRLLSFLLALLMMFTLLVPVASAATTSTSITVTASNDAKTGKVKLTWKAVKNAKKYEVYRATSKSGTYSKYSTTTKLTYTNTTAVAGNTYYYKVKAINSSGKVLTTSAVASRTCDCAQPVVTASNAASSGKVSLKWNAVTGAAKYEVWRATSKTGTYTKNLTTTKTSMTNSSTVAGKTYYYKVKAISSKTSAADSAYSAIVSRTCDLAKPVIKVSAVEATGKNCVKWDPVEGATAYEIWRATSKTGTFTKQYTTNSTSYTNTSGKAGSTYYYKVKALYGDVTAASSAFSDVKYRTCDCAMMKNVSVDYDDEGHIIFTWDAVDGATGYKIYRADKQGGEYKLLGKPTECKFTDTTAKVGQYYYYKLIACNSKTSSADSAPVEGPALPLYPKPKNLKASTNVLGNTVVSWSKVSGVDGYVILRGTTDNLEEMEPLAGVTKLQSKYTDNGEHHGVYYCIIGVKDMGEDEDPIPTVPAILYVK